CIEVRFSGRKIDNVDPASCHRFCGRGYGQGGGGGNSPRSRSKFHDFKLLIRACSWRATSGCRNSVSAPPWVATSLMMVEDKYEYSSLGIRNTVSTCLAILRFMSAI